MKNKVIKIGIILLSVLVICTMTIFAINKANVKSYDETKTNLYKNSKIINDYDVNLTTYGLKFDNQSDLKFNNIETMDEFDSSNVYNVLIIFDYSSSIKLEEEDYLELKNIVDSKINLMVIYYGQEKINDFKKYDLLQTNPTADTYGCIYGSNYIEGLILNPSVKDASQLYLEANIAQMVVSDFLKPLIGE